MKTFLQQRRRVETQKVVPFTGEGAYHGSTKARPRADPQPKPPPVVDEMKPFSLEKYGENREVAEIEAEFPNNFEVKQTLPVPCQTEIADDEVTFCWCPLRQAFEHAGPLTGRVLEAMAAHLEGHKRYVYIDSKIQYFRPGDLPVDSQLWHVDGSIAVRDERVRNLGYTLLHDMGARLQGPAKPPTYLAYQSSSHCATHFVTTPVQVRLPELIPNFDGLDAAVRECDPPTVAQPAGSVVRFDGLSLHRAVPASGEGWRLWVRCVETDRQVVLNSSIIECYGTVFRT